MASGADAPITVLELERLIRTLGMLGSAHDGEVLNAARFAVKWLAEKGTDWPTLLLPEPAPPTTGVAVGGAGAPTAAELTQRVNAAYDAGYKAGLHQAQQDALLAKARAHFQAAAAPAPTPGWPHGTWQAAAEELLAYWGHVFRGDRERDFVQSLLDRGFPTLTDKQDKWLRDIAGRAGLSW